jgi:L-asparaginase / beta-aspartyl-peptidase
MIRILALLAVTLASFRCLAQGPPEKSYVLVIHGGAGAMSRASMSAEKERQYRAALDKALDAGNAILKRGGSAVDAVVAAIITMEDNPMFNAGKGAVFTNAGKNELDASIMDGLTLKAGAVAGVTTIKNPITAARAVMDKSEHVMMTGKGAELFAATNGCTIVKPSYFYTQDRYQGLLKVKKQDSLNTLKKTAPDKTYLQQPGNRDSKYGTVGAVALDKNGNLAAATSTGGMTNKRFGRIGDSPIIGAGTYANNTTCAISCTGWGEYFIRLVMAKTVSDRVELAKENLQQAADEMIMRQLPSLGGDGGLIGIDKDGNIVAVFNTQGMFRGYIKSNGDRSTAIYKD